MTIISTYVAFKGTGCPVFAFRLGFGLASAFAIAIVVELVSRKRPWIDISEPGRRFEPILAAFPGPPRLRAPSRKSRASFASRAAEALEHASYDFLDTGRYLIAGISIAALARAFIPAEAILGSLGRPLSATGTGLVSAYVLSLCSSADAFVARSLFAPSSYHAVLAFLVLGPMIDLKNTVLLSRYLKPRVLGSFVVIALLVVGAMALAASPLLEAL
jgi:uncharacterized membrane protein YraQ (UPF0718 family)